MPEKQASKTALTQNITVLNKSRLIKMKQKNNKSLEKQIMLLNYLQSGDHKIETSHWDRYDSSPTQNKHRPSIAWTSTICKCAIPCSMLPFWSDSPFYFMLQPWHMVPIKQPHLNSTYGCVLIVSHFTVRYMCMYNSGEWERNL